MTDVTGFALMGHLLEMCEGSGVDAEVFVDQIPVLDAVHDYIRQGCVPGGTHRNFDSYGHKLAPMTDEQKALLCDPQTSGGLLMAVRPSAQNKFENLLKQQGINESLVRPIGRLQATRGELQRVRLV
ncbi:MAG TPA: AIR synthase-related protein [Pseudohongiella sp.]|nr:AIR synthase-related protein [Pseudohongiella sp.]